MRGLNVVHCHTASVTGGIPTLLFSTPNYAVNGMSGRETVP